MNAGLNWSKNDGDILLPQPSQIIAKCYQMYNMGKAGDQVSTNMAHSDVSDLFVSDITCWMVATFRAMAIDWKKTKIHRQKNVKVEKVICSPDEQEVKRWPVKEKKRLL